MKSVFADSGHRLIDIDIRRYSACDKKLILDYLFNAEFEFIFVSGNNREYDQIDGDIITVYPGSGYDGEYFWTYSDAVYIAKHNLAVSDDFMSKVKAFYDDGDCVEVLKVNWHDDANLFRSSSTEGKTSAASVELDRSDRQVSTTSA